MSGTIRWLCCGVLRTELEELHRLGKIGGTLQFLDSMLHMVPQTLDSLLDAKLRPQTGHADETLVLVYGDCSAHMLDMVRDSGCSRVGAVNCVQMLTGREHYRELMRAEAFVLLPEWALRWKEIMHTELGLTAKIAKDLMGEHRKEIVYLDTGLHRVPVEELAACSEYTGLPFRIEKTGLENLLALLKEAAGEPT